MNSPLQDQAVIKLTPKEQQEIHDLWKSPGFKVLIEKVLVQRQKNLSMVGISETTDFSQVSEYRGRILEDQWIAGKVHEIYKKINKQGDD